MNKWYAHLKTITRHKLLVMRHCFRIGLYWQGLTHDLSKYSPAEFLVGAKYYQGDRSPNDAERREKGYSSAWLHHKGRNKHHLEYWIDYTPGGDHHMGGVEMPVQYVAEMFCARPGPHHPASELCCSARTDAADAQGARGDRDLPLGAQRAAAPLSSVLGSA